LLSRLVAPKGIEDAIRAMAHIVHGHARASMVIVGAGPHEPQLRKLVGELRLGAWIHFVGFRKDVADCLHSFDCFLSPSLSEGFGLTILEAMAAGLPIIATPVGGIVEIIEDGQSGLFVKERSCEGIATAVLRLANSREERRNLGLRARDRASRCFSIE